MIQTYRFRTKIGKVEFQHTIHSFDIKSSIDKWLHHIEDLKNQIYSISPEIVAKIKEQFINNKVELKENDKCIYLTYLIEDSFQITYIDKIIKIKEVVYNIGLNDWVLIGIDVHKGYEGGFSPIRKFHDEYKEVFPKKDKLDFEFLQDNVEFINSLSSIAIKKSTLQNSEEYQTFLNKPCKFMFLYDINSNELENPVYLLFQVWNESIKKWDDVKLYKINDDVKKFYDKLTSRTIEIVDGDQNYIYQTSNGNEWVLQNVDKENDIYKKTFRKEELQEMLASKSVTVNII
jgi:hypothetical protein